jgi:hypothetical protein
MAEEVPKPHEPESETLSAYERGELLAWTEEHGFKLVSRDDEKLAIQMWRKQKLHLVKKQTA